MAEFDFDLFVIGGGSGGVRAGRVAAQSGARVAVAEEFRFGGTCVIRGCVPKKLLVYASQFAADFEDAAGFGWTVGTPSFSWSELIAAKDREIARLEGLYQQGLRSADARIFAARAVLEDPHHVRLSSGERFSAKHILVATGATPVIPDLPGSELAITSNEIFHLERLPERIVIVGGGYIACEFACILNGLGVEVTHIYRGDRLLRGFDADVRAHLIEAEAASGIDLRLETRVNSISGTRGALRLELSGGDRVEAGEILYATGRRPNSFGLGLEALGVGIGRNGAICVDEWSQTAVPSVFAVGDVTDRIALTPVAIREGQAFADTVFKSNPTRFDHNLVASAVFTQPEIGTIGLTEEEARAAGPVEIYRSRFRPMRATLSGRDEAMLMKLVVDTDSRRVVGCHIVGHAAGEMIQLAGVSIGMGATKEDFDRTVAVHPTAAEELVTMREPVA